MKYLQMSKAQNPWFVFLSCFTVLRQPRVFAAVHVEFLFPMALVLFFQQRWGEDNKQHMWGKLKKYSDTW